jgi:transposase
MEVITRTERRRTYSEAEKAAVVAEASAPGVTVREVSQRLCIAESLIYNWRSAQRKAVSIASEPLQFIPYGVVTDVVPTEPSMALMPPPAPASAKPSPSAAPAEDLVRPHPGTRPGSIDIDLASGVRLSVDSYAQRRRSPACCGTGACIVIALAPGTKVYLACKPVSMQKGFDGLTALASQVLGADPYSGHLFVFRASVATISRRCTGTARACACSPSGWRRAGSSGPRWSMAASYSAPQLLALLIEGIDWRRTVALAR